MFSLVKFLDDRDVRVVDVSSIKRFSYELALKKRFWIFCVEDSKHYKGAILQLSGKCTKILFNLLLIHL